MIYSQEISESVFQMEMALIQPQSSEESPQSPETPPSESDLTMDDPDRKTEDLLNAEREKTEQMSFLEKRVKIETEKRKIAESSLDDIRNENERLKQIIQIFTDDVRRVSVRGGSSDFQPLRSGKGETNTETAGVSDEVTEKRYIKKISKGVLKEMGQEAKSGKRPERLAELLIAAPVGSVNSVVDYEGWSLFMLAAVNRRFQTMKMLIEKGADINLQNDDGETALHVAALNRHRDVVNFLLDSDCDVNVRNGNGETALHIAVFYRDLEIMNMLVDGGIDVNIKDNKGWTALHEAASAGHLTLVKFLVQQGKADPFIWDNRGDTALDLAKSFKMRDVVKFLKLKIGKKQSYP